MTRCTRLRGFAAVACVVAIAVVASGCGSSEKSSEPQGYAAKNATPQLRALIDGANREGELDLNWAAAADAATYQHLLKAFKNAYGLKIKTQLTPDTLLPALLQTMLEQQKAGKKASSDAFLGATDQMLNGGPSKANAFKIVDWKGIIPSGVQTKQITSDGSSVKFLDTIPAFTYNTSKLSEDELPKTIYDVTKVKQPWATTFYAAQFNALGATIGADGVLKYAKTLNPKGYISCAQLDRVATGEFNALWINCGKNLADILIEKGAPLKSIVLKDGALTTGFYGAVPKNSAHPNAATLWVSYLNSPEAQKILFDEAKTDNSSLPGSEVAKQIKEFSQTDGVKFTAADYEFALKHPELFSAKFTGELAKTVITD